MQDFLQYYDEFMFLNHIGFKSYCTTGYTLSYGGFLMNNKYKILVIEDEAATNNLLTALLESNGYRAISAKSCRTGQLLFSSHRPDLVILNLGLPDADGMTFLTAVRSYSLTPVIILSARSDEKSKVQALDSGANDYITKPFGSEELVARVRAALRNARHSADAGRFPGGRYAADGLVIDYDARRVFIAETEIRLTQTEYNILALLSEYAGKLLPYTAIIKALWGHSDPNSNKKLQVNMANIRKKFRAASGTANYIVNEPGVGYRMNGETLF